MVLEAFDINEVANDVYEHNFGHRPSQVSILAQSGNFLQKKKHVHPGFAECLLLKALVVRKVAWRLCTCHYIL